MTWQALSLMSQLASYDVASTIRKHYSSDSAEVIELNCNLVC